MTADGLYYLVREGTNIRLTNKDNEPILVERAHVSEQRDLYARITKSNIRAMTVHDYVETYLKPVMLARAEAKRSAWATMKAPAEEEGL